MLEVLDGAPLDLGPVRNPQPTDLRVREEEEEEEQGKSEGGGPVSPVNNVNKTCWLVKSLYYNALITHFKNRN